ncbi:porin [Hyphomicrobium nitrativorans NL23]|uniref:Porin n=1 Tax=Hyphomicrobium nitrativorans NL23 TaxID=1029756 RepID=V5SCP0_9HYPH|nr:outer membrane beta-barrel protein [Hyphomicrobium nitrativorans]AHB47739.1 porin [Hyphomicrobium nitrativorans NL23]
MIRQALTHVRPALMAVPALILMATAGAVPAQAEQWNGVYIGAFVGGAWSRGDIESDAGTLSPQSYFSNLVNIALVEGDASGTGQGQSFAGGAQLGVNRRFDQFVVGGEVDFSAFDLSGDVGAINGVYLNFPTLAYNVSASYSADWLFTARGRLGWLASPNLLVYLTGGLAVADVKVSNSFHDEFVVAGRAGARGASSHTSTKIGYTLGGGVELALDGSWSLKAEYLYVDLGKTSSHAMIVPPVGTTRSPLDTSASINASIARIGLNYSFYD